MFKKALTILILVIFLTISVIGFLSMTHSEFFSCLTGSKAECPGMLNLAEYLQFHFGLYKIFSTAVLACFLFLAIVFVLYRIILDKIILPKVALSKILVSDFGHANPSKKFIDWLSLLESSPN